MSDTETSITRTAEKTKPKTTYVKIYRQIFDGELAGDGICVALFVYLIAKANRFEKKFRDEILPPGCVRRASTLIMEDLGISKKVFFRCLNKLEKYGMVGTQRDHHGTRINVCNYLKYQVYEEVAGTRMGPPRDLPRVPPREMRTIKKERKKETKKENIYTATLTASQRDLVFEWVKFSTEASKTKLQPNVEVYAKALLDIDRLCGVGEEKMRSILAFVRTDDFWRPNAISLAGLLKKNQSGVRKIENLLQSMESGGTRLHESGRTLADQRKYEEWLKSP